MSSNSKTIAQTFLATELATQTVNVLSFFGNHLFGGIRLIDIKQQKDGYITVFDSRDIEKRRHEDICVKIKLSGKIIPMGYGSLDYNELYKRVRAQLAKENSPYLQKVLDILKEILQNMPGSELNPEDHKDLSEKRDKLAALIEQLKNLIAQCPDEYRHIFEDCDVRYNYCGSFAKASKNNGEFGIITLYYNAMDANNLLDELRITLAHEMFHALHAMATPSWFSSLRIPVAQLRVRNYPYYGDVDPVAAELVKESLAESFCILYAMANSYSGVQQRIRRLYIPVDGYPYHGAALLLTSVDYLSAVDHIISNVETNYYDKQYWLHSFYCLADVS